MALRPGRSRADVDLAPDQELAAAVLDGELGDDGEGLLGAELGGLDLDGDLGAPRGGDTEDAMLASPLTLGSPSSGAGSGAGFAAIAEVRPAGLLPAPLPPRSHPRARSWRPFWAPRRTMTRTT